MVKAWKLNAAAIAVVVIGEPAIAEALASVGLEDRCLTDHESQFHIPTQHLHRYARILGLGSAAQAALRQTPPGSDLMITAHRVRGRLPGALFESAAQLNGSLAEMLVELKNVATTTFVWQDFDYHHASKILRRVARDASAKPIRFRDLRHSFASNFVMRGGSIYKLQRLLGHRSIQMTERYSHLSPDHLDDATELLDFGTRAVNSVVALPIGATAG